MVILKKRKGRYSLSLFDNPLPRVLKFEKVYKYYTDMPSGCVVLDYGSGDCPYKNMFLDKFERYISADYSSTNKKYNCKPDKYINDYKVDLPDESIDCIILTEVLEHLYEPIKVLEEINRLLKPGGILVGTVPFLKNQHDQPHDYHRYTYFCLEKMFKDSSFDVIKLEYVGDSISSLLSLLSNILSCLPKAFLKIRWHLVAYFLNQIIRIPEYAYYLFYKVGVQPYKFAYFRTYPLGFTFLVKKNGSLSDFKRT